MEIQLFNFENNLPVRTVIIDVMFGLQDLVIQIHAMH